MQDWGNRSTHVGSTMTTWSIKVQIPFLVNTMSTHQQKELRVVKGSACSYFLPTWKLTCRIMAAKVSWTSSWVPMHSFPWMQHKKWIHVKLMGCVHTHQRGFAIEGCGNPSYVLSVMEKIGENNRKVGKDNGNPFAKSSRWKQFWRCSKIVPKGWLANEFSMRWNINLKESNESSKS